MRYLPIGLAVAGKRCLVIGGGRVALDKVRVLAPSGARITVVSPEFVAELAACDGLELIRRPFRPADLEGMALGIAATNNATVNAAFAEACQARGVWCNVVDDPALCDFVVPAIVRRGPLSVSVLTDGTAPALAKRLRQELERRFSAEFAEYVAFLGEAREAARRTRAQAPRRQWLAERLASEQGQQRFFESTPAQRQTWLAQLLAEAQQGVEDDR